MDEEPEDIGLLVQRVDPELPLPGYAKQHDAGLDLFAATDAHLSPGERALVPTGLAVAIPAGWVGLVHPRSGLAARHGITVLNAPGTVDAGYRGEILVNLINLDPREEFSVKRGDRIAQLLLQRVGRASLHEVDVLPASHRGHTGHGDSGGFGHSS
ncbi:dUTP diphosphatase [Gephyromycinifex aptenodytis]|uniref:dUTP diphosphatase n=1 Tax=Gephyromycinifex aptenodytis TaxID=2716227 RepID=UPI0014477965|nr:dUTP diphosphatase [Gephyromycinifex aptenodytis]